MSKELKLSLMTAVIYFLFYNIITYTVYKTFKLEVSIISSLIFFVVYYILLNYIRKKKGL